MVRALIGSGVGFLAGATYGAVYAVQVPDGKLAVAAKLVKVLWEVFGS